jgi:alpha-D-xyloside xylohydrolase
LDIADKYRALQYPIDTIVQDWYYWNPYPWGTHRFDKIRYPDPAAAIKVLHEKYHIRIMISVWGKFNPGNATNPNENFQALESQKYLYPDLHDWSAGCRYYDSFDASARAIYWQQMNDGMYSKGFDAWWLDASEPEVNMAAYRTVKTAAGYGGRVLNAYPLHHSTGVQQGTRKAAPNKRVYILTRSAYAGSQRTSASIWSGDIKGTWDDFKLQIPAGLNAGLSGMPYWTTDIGGFFVYYPGGTDNPEYRELFARWFAYGSFCPIFRVHGTGIAKEMWRFGPVIEKILAKYDKLRYRLLPYTYSLSALVHFNSYIIMRALVMDFPQDVTARELKDQFMFGPAFLVNPVIVANATSRDVYLPNSTWVNFWTGETKAGLQTINTAAPLDTLPLFIRAGSIIPMGPFLQYATEKPADPLEIRIYKGADGSFVLYEDENDGYGYETGQYATILLTWNDKARQITVNARAGSFPGMLQARTLQFVCVRPNHGVGLDISNPDAVITYNGHTTAVVIQC